MTMNAKHDFERFEELVCILMRKAGWDAKIMPRNHKGHDIEARRGKEFVAVQVKDYRVPVKVPQVEKFLDYMESPEASKFTKGFLVTSSKYSPQSLAYYAQSSSSKTRLAVIAEGDIKWIGENFVLNAPVAPKKRLTYVGVFTCKGGVGKTTVSAHLAGALAMSGYDVALVDMDPQRNLTTLLGEGVNLPGLGGKRSVTVYGIDEWIDTNPPEDIKMVVCDCSPAFDKNPSELVKKFDYCIIPTTLNPLGLNKNGHVIKSTLAEIRSINITAELFVLINNYIEDETVKGKVLREAYQEFFKEFANRDKRFHFIDPDEASIRTSKQLFYWGYHLYNGGRSELAFTPYAGKCLPKADFLNLLQYLEENTAIEKLKGT